MISSNILPNTHQRLQNSMEWPTRPPSCPPSCCEPPDMAIAASPRWVFQGVTQPLAVYNNKGTLAEWIQNDSRFLAFLTRAVATPMCIRYRPSCRIHPSMVFLDSHWLQLQGGFVDRCPPLSLYWVGVSPTNDPNGAWNMYAPICWLALMASLTIPRLALMGEAAYFSINIRNKLLYIQVCPGLAASKAQMESGSGRYCERFQRLRAGINVCGIRSSRLRPATAQWHQVLSCL